MKFLGSVLLLAVLLVAFVNASSLSMTDVEGYNLQWELEPESGDFTLNMGGETALRFELARNNRPNLPNGIIIGDSTYTQQNHLLRSGELRCRDGVLESLDVSDTEAIWNDIADPILRKKKSMKSTLSGCDADCQLERAFNEDFETVFPGWTSGSLNGDNGLDTWQLATESGGIVTAATNTVSFDSQVIGAVNAGALGVENSYLQSPRFDTSAGVIIDFEYWLGSSAICTDTFASLESSVDGGRTWTELMDCNVFAAAPQQAWQSVSLEFTGSINTIFRYRWQVEEGVEVTNAAVGFFIDNFHITWEEIFTRSLEGDEQLSEVVDLQIVTNPNTLDQFIFETTSDGLVLVYQCIAGDCAQTSEAYLLSQELFHGRQTVHFNVGIWDANDALLVGRLATGEMTLNRCTLDGSFPLVCVEDTTFGVQLVEDASALPVVEIIPLLANDPVLAEPHVAVLNGDLHIIWADAEDEGRYNYMYCVAQYETILENEFECADRVRLGFADTPVVFNYLAGSYVHESDAAVMIPVHLANGLFHFGAMFTAEGNPYFGSVACSGDDRAEVPFVCESSVTDQGVWAADVFDFDFATERRNFNIDAVYTAQDNSVLYTIGQSALFAGNQEVNHHWSFNMIHCVDLDCSNAPEQYLVTDIDLDQQGNGLPSEVHMSTNPQSGLPVVSLSIATGTFSPNTQTLRGSQILTFQCYDSNCRTAAIGVSSKWLAAHNEVFTADFTAAGYTIVSTPRFADNYKVVSQTYLDEESLSSAGTECGPTSLGFKGARLFNRNGVVQACTKVVRGDQYNSDLWAWLDVSASSIHNHFNVPAILAPFEYSSQTSCDARV